MQTKNRMEQVGNDLRAASRNLWLAGLGAASSMEEGGRKLFGQLVERGERWQSKDDGTLRQAGDRFKEATHKVEQQIESSMTSTLHRFGVPARDDVQELIDRIEVLTDKVESLSEA